MSKGKIIKDDIDKFFEYGVYPDTRTVYVGSNDGNGDGEVNEELAEKAIKGLHILDLPRSANKPITVMLNSPGGEEYQGQAIFDAIRDCDSEIIVKVYGQASSMGSIILQAGDHRVMMPNAIVMIHYGSPIHVDPDATPRTNYNWIDECKRFDKWMEDLYLEKIRKKHPKFTRAKIKAMLEHDTIIPAQEAVALGLADSVEEPKEL